MHYVLEESCTGFRNDLEESEAVMEPFSMSREVAWHRSTIQALIMQIQGPIAVIKSYIENHQMLQYGQVLPFLDKIFHAMYTNDEFVSRVIMASHKDQILDFQREWHPHFDFLLPCIEYTKEVGLLGDSDRKKCVCITRNGRMSSGGHEYRSISGNCVDINKSPLKSVLFMSCGYPKARPFARVIVHGYKDTEIRYKGRRFFSASPLCAVIVDFAKLREYSNYIEQRDTARPQTNGVPPPRYAEIPPLVHRPYSPPAVQQDADGESPSGYNNINSNNSYRKRVVKKTSGGSSVTSGGGSCSDRIGSDPLQFLSEFNSLVSSGPGINNTVGGETSGCLHNAGQGSIVVLMPAQMSTYSPPTDSSLQMNMPYRINDDGSQLWETHDGSRQLTSTDQPLESQQNDNLYKQECTPNESRVYKSDQDNLLSAVQQLASTVDQLCRRVVHLERALEFISSMPQQFSGAHWQNLIKGETVHLPSTLCNPVANESIAQLSSSDDRSVAADSSNLLREERFFSTWHGKHKAADDGDWYAARQDQQQSQEPCNGIVYNEENVRNWSSNGLDKHPHEQFCIIEEETDSTDSTYSPLDIRSSGKRPRMDNG